jgi:hypothetical protein
MDSAISLYSAAKIIVYVDKISAFHSVQFYTQNVLFFYSFSTLSDDRSKASSKTIPPHSAI